MWAIAPVRDHGFFGFWGCFSVRGDLGQGKGLVDQGVMRIFPVIPLFWLWLLLGIMHFLDFGDVSGSGGIWDKAGDWLIRVGGEEWVL